MKALKKSVVKIFWHKCSLRSCCSRHGGNPDCGKYFVAWHQGVLAGGKGAWWALLAAQYTPRVRVGSGRCGMGLASGSRAGKYCRNVKTCDSSCLHIPMVPVVMTYMQPERKLEQAGPPYRVHASPLAYTHFFSIRT